MSFIQLVSDPRMAPNPLLAKTIKLVNQKMYRAPVAASGKQDVEMEALTESSLEDNTSHDSDVTSNATNQTMVNWKWDNMSRDIDVTSNPTNQKTVDWN